jgi:hypothetical protein
MLQTSEKDGRKYDEKLREEFEILQNPDGSFSVEVTRVGKKTVVDDMGNFRTYEEAKEAMFEKFNQDFNRPSEMAIRAKGYSPLERVWDATDAGRQVKHSISIIEGETAFTAEQTRPKEQVIKIRTDVPVMITVRELYPRYFNGIVERHRRRISRMRGTRRMGRLSPRFGKRKT